MSQLMKTIIQFPNANWDWYSMPTKGFTPEFIMRFADKPWNYSDMNYELRNKLPLNMRLNFIMEGNFKCSMEELVCYYEYIVIYKENLCYWHPANWTSEFIECNLSHGDLLWASMIVDLEFIIVHPDIINWRELLSNPSFNIPFFKANVDKPWRMRWMSNHPLMIEMFKIAPHLDWDMNTIQQKLSKG